MERGEQLSDFINSLVSDTRLRPIHIAQSTALCNARITNQFRQPYNISRSQLTQACRIHSKATYHKTLRELQVFGYLEHLDMTFYGFTFMNWFYGMALACIIEFLILIFIINGKRATGKRD